MKKYLLILLILSFNCEAQLLQSVISQSSGNIIYSDISTPFDVLTPSVDTTSDTVYWFRAYLSTDFPEVTCDKTYFFLWSTDHDSGDGGIWWGKGNNLDLSDFVEIGLILDGYQAETPYLIRLPNETSKIVLFYHTTTSEPGNGGKQQTRQWVTPGGELHTATWTDLGRPLGVEVGDTHTGYLSAWLLDDGTWKAYHSYATNGSYLDAQWSTSPNGLIWTRGNYRDVTTGLESGRRVTGGHFFKKYGQWWFIGNTTLITGFSSTTNRLELFKSSNDLESLEHIANLNGGALGEYWEICIFGNTAYLYQNNNSNDVKYATFDLLQLQNYL